MIVQTLFHVTKNVVNDAFMMSESKRFFVARVDY